MKKIFLILFLFIGLTCFAQNTSNQLDSYSGISTGTNNYSVTITANNIPNAPYNNQTIKVFISNTNSGASTLKVNSYSAINIINNNGVALSGGELTANTWRIFIYNSNSSSWQLVSGTSNSSGTVTSVGLSGGSTGLSFSGGPITTAGTFTSTGTLNTNSGGTGTNTTFTKGSAIFAGTSGVYSQNNNNFFWDDTKTFFGLGTNTPNSRLDVQNTGTVSAVNINTVGDYTTTAIGTGLKVNAEGSISPTGIDVNAKSINGGIANAIKAYAVDTNTTGYNYGSSFIASRAKYNTASLITASGGTESIGLDVTAYGATNNYAALFRQGLVGIGTGTPTQPLQIQSSSGTGTQLYINTTSGSPGICLGNNTIMASASHQAMFGMATTSNEFLGGSSNGDAIIDSKSGRILIGIGASSGTGGTPYAIFNTNGLSLGDGNINLPDPSARLYVTGSGTTTATSPVIVNNSANTELFRITNGGSIGINIGTIPSAALDIKSLGNTSSTSALRIINSSSTNILTLKDNGYLGLGTTGPVAPLDIVSTGTASATYAMKVSSNSGATAVFFVGNDGKILVNESSNTTAGDAATLNVPTGRFRKDNSGSTFTLTNSLITTSSTIILQSMSSGITGGKYMTYTCTTGSATITFEDTVTGAATAPSGNMDVAFWIVN